MKHAEYIGPLATLHGKGALVQATPDLAQRGVLLAQFDDVNAAKENTPFPMRYREVIEYEPHARFPTETLVPIGLDYSRSLGFGWHEFPIDHFKIEP